MTDPTEAVINGVLMVVPATLVFILTYDPVLALLAGIWNGVYFGMYNDNGGGV